MSDSSSYDIRDWINIKPHHVPAMNHHFNVHMQAFDEQYVAHGGILESQDHWTEKNAFAGIAARGFLDTLRENEKKTLTTISSKSWFHSKTLKAKFNFSTETLNPDCEERVYNIEDFCEVPAEFLKKANDRFLHHLDEFDLKYEDLGGDKSLPIYHHDKTTFARDLAPLIVDHFVNCTRYYSVCQHGERLNGKLKIGNSPFHRVIPF